ncbi:MAG: ABC transporter permease [Asgard group archaeon]|nr:ABC transporter permease [Asgard group archaeon]
MMVGFQQRLRLYFKIVFMNRRTTILMFLGLGISLALISESLMFMYSFQYDSFTGFTNGVPTRQFTVTLSAFDVTDYEEASIPILNEQMSIAIENAEISDRVKRFDWFLSRGFVMVALSSSSYNVIIPDFSLIGIPSDYFSVISSLLSNGTLPQRIDQGIVVARQAVLDNTNLSKLGMFSIYTPIFGLTFQEVVDLGIPAGGIRFNSSGYMSYEKFSNVIGPSENDFQAMTELFPEQFILTSYNNLAHLASKVEYNTGYVSPTGRIQFDLAKIDAFNINQEISQLTRFSQEISRELENVGFDPIVYTTLIDLLNDFNQEFVIFQLFGLLFITPIIGMAFFLTNYSANLMKRRQKRQISSMLQRGSSQKEVMFVLLMQVVELTITALLIALILGYGFTWLNLRSTGFLNFAGTSMFPTINMIIFYVIITAGFVLSVIINAKNVWEMSQITTQEAYTEHQEEKSVWHKLYLDVALIGIGIVLWVIVKSQLSGTSAYAFAYGFGTSAPVLLVIGAILFTTRIYPIIIDFISNKSWQGKKFGLLAIATKRSARRKSDVTKSLVLITLTFTLIFSSVVTIESYRSYDTEIAYYQLGSDILVRGVNVQRNTTKDTVLTIEGVESATYLKITSQIITFGPVTYSYLAIGIDPEEFVKTAYMEKQYLRGSTPEEFFGAIVDNNDVVMQSDQLDLIASYQGDQLSIIYEKYLYGYVNRTLDIVGIYKYFPRFFVDFPEEDAPVFRFSIVGNYNNTEEFAYAPYSVGGDLIVKVQDGYDIDDVADEIELRLGRSVDSVSDLKGVSEGSLRNTMLYGSLNASFLSSIVIIISAVIFMILVQAFENEREVITMKILGMAPRQLFSIFLLESLIVVIFGAIIGIGTGILTANMFTEILTYENIIPPTEMVFPAIPLLLASLLLFASAIAAAALTAFLVFRKDTIEAVKQI